MIAISIWLYNEEPHYPVINPVWGEASHNDAFTKQIPPLRSLIAGKQHN